MAAGSDSEPSSQLLVDDSDAADNVGVALDSLAVVRCGLGDVVEYHIGIDRFDAELGEDDVEQRGGVGQWLGHGRGGARLNLRQPTP